MQTYASRPGDDPGFAAYKELVESTPALREASDRMWRRHESALTTAIAEATGAPEDDIASAALARFALETLGLLRGRDDPPRMLGEVFALLEKRLGSRTGRRGVRRGAVTQPGSRRCAITDSGGRTPRGGSNERSQR